MDQSAQLMNQMKAASQAQYLQQLVSKMSDSCFEKCVKRPRYALDSSQQTCISNCMDNFLEAMEAVGSVVVENMQKQQSQSVSLLLTFSNDSRILSLCDFLCVAMFTVCKCQINLNPFYVPSSICKQC